MGRKLIIIFVVLLAVLAFYAFYKYQEVYAPNVPEKLSNDLLQIPDNSTFADVVNILHKEKMIIDTASFSWAAAKMNYKKPKMRAGQFKIQPGASNIGLIRHLRSGKQEPVKIIINNERFVSEIISIVAPSFMN